MAAMPHDETDETLMLQVQQGSHEAFSVLVRRHSTPLYAMAYRSLMRRSEAEDVVQEAFVVLWQNPDAWDAERNSRFKSWFYRLVMNRCIDEHRRKKPSALPEGYDVAEDDSEWQEKQLLEQQSQRVKRAVSELPERQQWAINLCVYQEMGQQEAADIMGLSRKAVESLIGRAKAQLKLLVSDESS